MTETFDFGKVTIESVEYRDNGRIVEFGDSYTFSAQPTSPPRRLHTINVDGMRFYTTVDGELDDLSNPTTNIKALEAFYEEHERWKTFFFDSPSHGLISVKFSRAFVVPKPIRGGSGLCPTITLSFEEQR